MQMYKEVNHNIRLINNPFNSFSRRILQQTQIFSLKRNQSKNPQKLLTNNHTVSLHRQHPKKTRHHLQLLKTSKHLREFLSKITQILLKNDTLAYLNH